MMWLDTTSLLVFFSARTYQLLTISAIPIIVFLLFVVVWQKRRQKELEANMAALQAQINPQFVSNSLNAIENLIHQDKKQEAAKYIIHFSRLSRQILNRSRNQYMSLKEELRMLKHFLELEKLRFRDKLNFEILVDSDLEQDLIQIQSLILQPYVENAIWYGIKPKVGKSNLKIAVKKEGKYLLVIIEDDGIGRVNSKALRAANAVQHKSMGMKIREERIGGVRKVRGVEVDIVDLYKSSGGTAGTQVQIRFPLKYKK